MRKRIINTLAVFLILGTSSLEAETIKSIQFNSIESEQFESSNKKGGYLNFDELSIYGIDN